MTAPAASVRFSVVGHTSDGAQLRVRDLDGEGRVVAESAFTPDSAPRFVAERPQTRWVWSDTAAFYPHLLRAGVRVARAWDLRLCHTILRTAAVLPGSTDPVEVSSWDAPAVASGADDDGLFTLAQHASEATDTVEEAADEFARQRSALAAATDEGRLRMLLSAESAGALVAVEMHAAGVPWSVPEHDRILTEILGERAMPGALPIRIREWADAARAALGDDSVNLDSPAKLLAALRRGGIPVASTSRWELADIDHPAIEPLLAYKRLMRLYVANGWSWLEEWVHEGRFRPVYVPGGVVTGRWASSGGGALQLSRQLRPAVRADPGWVIIDADVAQLEPRVLAAMSRDTAMAEAAHGRDLYAGIVASGAVSTRAEAKIALLGAMYGATTGESGRLVPRLRRSYPRAMQLVDDAARTGEDGGVVRTWLRRTCPPPEERWRAATARASESDVTGAERERAGRIARDRGRFTRNFIVQGTAAEWALCWLAEIRRRLDALGEVTAGAPAVDSGALFAARPHLVLFLHDEVMVHAPRELADAAADAVREAAASAGRLLFGSFPIDFPLDVHIGDAAAGH